MESVTKTIHQTSDHHSELGVSRRNGGFRGFRRFLQSYVHGLITSILFISLMVGLQSLSNGLVSLDDGINCDKATKLPKKNEILTLICLANGVTVNKREVHIEPFVLFTQLIVLIERSPAVNKHFNYELTPITNCSIQRIFMRKHEKASLATTLINISKNKGDKGRKQMCSEICNEDENADVSSNKDIPTAPTDSSLN